MTFLVQTIIYSIIASIIVFFWINQLRFSIKQTKWPKTKGTILESKIAAAKSRMVSQRHVGAQNSKVSGEIEYEVKGKHYVQPIPVRFKTNYRSALEKELAKFTPGTTIDIYFNPNDPSEFCISKPKMSVIKILLYLFVMAVFILLYARGIWSLLQFLVLE